MGQILFNVASEVDSGYSGPPITWLMHTDGGTDSQAVILENGGSQNDIIDYGYKSDNGKNNSINTSSSGNIYKVPGYRDHVQSLGKSRDHICAKQLINCTLVFHSW